MPAEGMPWPGLAPFIGAHAVPLFLAVLVAVVLLVGFAWRALRHFGMWREKSSATPAVFLLAHLALGFGVVVCAAVAFAAFAEALEADHALGRFDQQLSAVLRAETGPGTLRTFWLLTHLGNTATLTGLCILGGFVLLAAGRRGLALGWVVAIAGNAVLNRTLKAVFERVRPVHDHGLLVEEGWSFPSGHASGTVVVYGMLAYVLVRTLPARWHLPAVMLAAAVAFATGCSRVFLQVHFASDVLAGFASGIAWLTVCIASMTLTRDYRRPREAPR
jgi:undecaprenyl-diphosphatase